MPFDEAYRLAGSLSAKALHRRLPLAGLERYQRGRTIVFRGEILSKVYVVFRGRVQATYELALGATALELRPGDFFGETCALEGNASDCLVEAASRETVVLAIPVECLRTLLNQDAALKQAFLERVAERRTILGAALIGWRGFDPSQARNRLWSA